MSGVTLSIIIVVVLIVIHLIPIGWLFLRTSKEQKAGGKNLGTNMFKDIKTPEIFMSNQRYWRYAYTIFKILHFEFLIIGIISSAITVYMIIDTVVDNTLRVAFSIIALTYSSLSTCINPDKIATAYGSAFRIMEQAIIQYGCKTGQILPPDSSLYSASSAPENIDDYREAYKILSDANLEAQKIIEDKYG